MSMKENKESLLQVIKEWNELSVDVSKVRSLYNKHFAPDYMLHTLHRGDWNLEQTIQGMSMFLSAFSHFKYVIDDLLAEGDKVVLAYTSQATIKGDYMGIPAAGKQLVVKGVEIYKIVRGKIKESWDFHDSLGGMIQLGIIPGTESRE
jgi:predicted ester cyclase